MNDKTLLQKIVELNDYCEESLGFQNYTKGWEISSFRRGTLFNVEGKLYEKNHDYLKHRDFSVLVDLAYQEMLKDKRGGK